MKNSIFSKGRFEGIRKYVSNRFMMGKIIFFVCDIIFGGFMWIRCLCLVVSVCMIGGCIIGISVM